MWSPGKFFWTGTAAIIAMVSVASAEVRTGDPFPDLARFGLQGSLPDCTGKVVLVEFWATWCGPCKEAFPIYTNLQRELAGRGFAIIAVSVDRQQNEYEGFLKKFVPEFCTVRDRNQKLAAEVKVPVMPTSYLIDRHGILRSVNSGFHGESTVRALRDQIIKLLEEKA